MALRASSVALDDQPWVLGRGAQETSRVRPAGLALALKLGGEPAEASARTDPWNWGSLQKRRYARILGTLGWGSLQKPLPNALAENVNRNLAIETESVYISFN